MSRPQWKQLMPWIIVSSAIGAMIYVVAKMQAQLHELQNDLQSVDDTLSILDTIVVANIDSSTETD